MEVVHMIKTLEGTQETNGFGLGVYSVGRSILGSQGLLWLVNASSVEVMIAVSGLFAICVGVFTTVTITWNVQIEIAVDGWDSEGEGRGIKCFAGGSDYLD